MCVAVSTRQLWRKLSNGKSLFLIAGPCVIESEALCLRVARSLRKTCERLGVTYIFKASYDKANRTSGKSRRGPGLEKGLQILKTVREKVNVPVLTDIHDEAQARAAAEVVDVIQIPAFLCRQTDLIELAARTSVIVNLKKGYLRLRIRKPLRFQLVPRRLKRGVYLSFSLAIQQEDGLGRTVI